MDTLNRKLAIERGLTSEPAHRRPIKVIQFGEGNFLRAFVDWTIQRLNNGGLFNGNVAMIQSLPTGRIKTLQSQDNLYTVVLEGLDKGRTIRSREFIDSVGKTLCVFDQWEEYLSLADDPGTEIIVSNTTEAGIVVEDDDTVDMAPPQGFPAKLTHLLKRRFDAGLPGFLIIPCELIEDNGQVLHRAVDEVAHRFGFGEDFISWIDTENTFVSTLVDRIVPGYPKNEAETLWKELGYQDQMIDKAEPFYLWVIAGDEDARRRIEQLLPAKQLGIDIVTTDDVQPYRARKVYLLNAPHTTLAQVARLCGLKTVGGSMDDPMLRSFVLKEMHEEIMPVLTLPQEELETFADQVIERFSNPFNEHSLDSIGLNSVSKFVARLLPLIQASLSKTGSLPKRIVLALASLLYIYAGFSDENVNVQDSPEAMKSLRALAQHEDYVHEALSETSLWGSDLTQICGLEQLVADDMNGLKDRGIRELVAELS